MNIKETKRMIRHNWDKHIEYCLATCDFLVPEKWLTLYFIKNINEPERLQIIMDNTYLDKVGRIIDLPENNKKKEKFLKKLKKSFPHGKWLTHVRWQDTDYMLFTKEEIEERRHHVANITKRLQQHDRKEVNNEESS